MSKAGTLAQKLASCQTGIQGWKEFEDVCVEILCFLFVPPLTKPRIQKRTTSNTIRRDAVFPNRNFNGDHPWAHLYHDLEARLIPFEFKNYDKEKIGRIDVDQARNYLTVPMGRLAVIVCTKPPTKSARQRRNTIYSEERKVILFVTKDNLREMLFMTERGEDPAGLILDLIEEFYLEHE